MSVLLRPGLHVNSHIYTHTLRCMAQKMYFYTQTYVHTHRHTFIDGDTFSTQDIFVRTQTHTPHTSSDIDTHKLNCRTYKQSVFPPNRPACPFDFSLTNSRGLPLTQRGHSAPSHMKSTTRTNVGGICENQKEAHFSICASTLTQHVYSVVENPLFWPSVPAPHMNC